MGISLPEQTAYFLWSLVLGLTMGVLYDILRMLRMTLHAGRVHIMVTDILFFSLCGVITSLFALPFNKGDVRGFILFGEAAGFLVYRLTLGAAMGKVYAFSARLINAFVQKIRKILEIFFNFLLKSIARLVYNVNELIDRLRKKRTNRIQQRIADQRKRRLYKGKQHEQKKKRKTENRRKARRS